MAKSAFRRRCVTFLGVPLVASLVGCDSSKVEVQATGPPMKAAPSEPVKEGKQTRVPQGSSGGMNYNPGAR
jgi:hypothetical protein